MTRGARHCRFSSFRSKRLAARLSRRLCTRMSSTRPSWSTARHTQRFWPAILMATSSRCHLSPAQGCPAPDPVSEHLAEFQDPLPHRLVADDDAACRQHLLDHAQAEQEAKVQPNRVADDLGWKPVTGVAGENGRCHPSSYATSPATASRRQL